MNPKVPGAVVVGFVIRWLVTLAAGWAVGHHVIDTTQVPAFVQDGIAAVPALAMLAWSYRSWAKAELRAIAAAVTGLIHPAIKDPSILAQVAASPKVSPAVASAAASAAAKTAILLFLVLPMSGLLTACAQVAQAEAMIKANAAKISSLCDSDVIPIAQSTAANLLAMAFGPVAQAQASAVAACHAIDQVAQSATTVAWLQDQITIMKTMGKTLPPPIAPAPITGTPTAYLWYDRRGSAPG